MKYFKILALAATFILPSIGLAGNEGGHGDGAYVCPAPDISEIVDLYEGRTPGLVTPQGLRFASGVIESSSSAWTRR